MHKSGRKTSIITIIIIIIITDATAAATTVVKLYKASDATVVRPHGCNLPFCGFNPIHIQISGTFS